MPPRRRAGTRRFVHAAVLPAMGAVLGLLLSTLVVSPAEAHAVLQQVTPADGATLDEAPERVTLTFNEGVTTPPSAGIRVYDRNGERVDRGRAGPDDRANVIGVDLRESLGVGTYVVSWRAASADGHPLRGAWLFTVGDVEADESLLASLFASDTDRGTAVVAVALRWMLYVTTFLAAGGALAMGQLGRHLQDPAGNGADRSPPHRGSRVRRVLFIAALAAAALTIAGVPVQAALLSGLGLRAPGSATLGDVLMGWYGASAVVRLLACLAIAAWAGGRWHRGHAGVALVGALAVASFTLEGHTVTTSPVWLVATTGAVHLVAAALWTGGLVILALAIGRGGLRTEPLRGARLVGGFSRLATWAILAVVVAGGVLGWVEVRALHALTSTTYGWTLVSKLLLLVPIAAAGMYNNRRLVPAVLRAVPAIDRGAIATAGEASAPSPAGPPAGAVARLRRSLRIELVGVIAVLAVTAVLVGLQPAAEAAGVTGTYSTYVPLGKHELHLTVDPNRAGTNEIHLYVLGRGGRQADVPDDVTLALRQPARDLGPLRREATRLGSGHFFLSGPELSVPGSWELDIEIPISRFDVLTTTVPVTVNP